MNRPSAGVVFAGCSILLAGLALALTSDYASAVVTSVWEVDDYKQFDEGEAESALITSLGEVKPGWDTERIDLEFGTSWAAVYAGDGTVYLGTDDRARIYAVRGKKVEKVAQIPGAVAVVSLVVVGGDLYAGTMPKGEVWRVSAKSGKAEKVTALADAETVWSLAVGKSGTQIYAGTGPEGKLYRIDTRSKKAKVVFDSDDKRIMALTRTRDGAIWLGTSEEALLFRYDPAKNITRAMADFAGNEVTAIAEYRGGVLVAANELSEPSSSGAKTRGAVEKAAKKKTGGTKIDETKDKPGDDKAASTGAEAPRKGGRKGKGALFMVRGDGRQRQLHSLTSTYFTAIAVTPEGHIFAGAGDKGRVYVLDAEDAVSTAFDVAERRIDQLIFNRKSGLTFTTADGAALYRSAGPAKRATYTSKVFDADAPSRFGRLVWWGNGNLTVETRSGYTEEPGKGWSNWARLRQSRRAGGGSMRGEVASPPGRYFQYRVRFSQKGDMLQRTALYHLPQNRPTRVTEIDIEGDTSSKKKLVTLGAGTTRVRSPVIKLKWKVKNDDDDETVYSLAVRREGEVHWRPVATGDSPLKKTSFSWNTETFPDGYYRIRVTASDRLANSSTRVQEHHLTTPLVLVDNEKPRVSGVTVRYPSASARATDGMSAISEMAYSVDDGDWRVGTTVDGIFDEPTESLKIPLPRGLSPGVHTLAIRVADEAGNIGAATITFRVR